MDFIITLLQIQSANDYLMYANRGRNENLNQNIFVDDQFLMYEWNLNLVILYFIQLTKLNIYDFKTNIVFNYYLIKYIENRKMINKQRFVWSVRLDENNNNKKKQMHVASILDFDRKTKHMIVLSAPSTWECNVFGLSSNI